MSRLATLAAVFLLVVSRISSARVVTALEDLGEVLNRDDVVRIEKLSGARVTGRLVRIGQTRS